MGIAPTLKVFCLRSAVSKSLESLLEMQSLALLQTKWVWICIFNTVPIWFTIHIKVWGEQLPSIQQTVLTCITNSVKTLSQVIYHSSAQNSPMAHYFSLSKSQSSLITYTSLCDQTLLTSLTSSLAPFLHVTIFPATLASCCSLKMPSMLPAPPHMHTCNFDTGFSLYLEHSSPRCLLGFVPHL